MDIRIPVFSVFFSLYPIGGNILCRGGIGDPVGFSGFSGFSGVLVKSSLLDMVLVGSYRIFRIFRSSPEEEIFYQKGGG